MEAQFVTEEANGEGLGLGKLLAIVLSAGIPILLIGGGIFFFYISNQFSQDREESLGEVEVDSGAIQPSEVLGDKYKYKDEYIVVRGEVEMAPALCQRTTCPEDDSCCGCPTDRDLVLSDADKVIKDNEKQLKILDSDGDSFCSRQFGGCDYTCPGWQLGGVYDIAGTFMAKPPPKASPIKVFFDAYLEVDETELVSEVAFTSWFKKLLRLAEEVFESFKSSSDTYVVQ